jgi:ATP synthase (C/AC39) subunit
VCSDLQVEDCFQIRIGHPKIKAVTSGAFHAESIVRGHRSGLLKVPDYNNLCQCENLEDIKLNLVRTEVILAWLWL